jgi:hypothetical protein
MLRRKLFFTAKYHIEPFVHHFEAWPSLEKFRMRNFILRQSSRAMLQFLVR